MAVSKKFPGLFTGPTALRTTAIPARETRLKKRANNKEGQWDHWGIRGKDEIAKAKRWPVPARLLRDRLKKNVSQFGERGGGETAY